MSQAKVDLSKSDTRLLTTNNSAQNVTLRSLYKPITARSAKGTLSGAQLLNSQLHVLFNVSTLHPLHFLCG